LFRLAFDAAVLSFSGRQKLYERYYSGDPMRLAGTLYNNDTHIDQIIGMLDDLEARQNTGGSAPRSHPLG
jgi:4-hydroxyphenylacetate 3-monooxygenase